MHRRSFLATIAPVGAATTAGCSEVLPAVDDSSQPNTPRVTEVAAVTEWVQSGDLEAHRISEISISSRSQFAIAFVWEQAFDDGSAVATQDVTLRHADAGLLDSWGRHSSMLRDSSGVESVESAADFSTDVLEPGEITAEVRVRNESTGEASDTETETFTAVQ